MVFSGHLPLRFDDGFNRADRPGAKKSDLMTAVLQNVWLLILFITCGLIGSTDGLTPIVGAAERTAFVHRLITRENREHSERNRQHSRMFGGWGPHLRGLMQDHNGDLWFTADHGPDVHRNTAIRYFRFRDGS